MPTQMIRRTWDYAQLAGRAIQLRWSRSDKTREAAQKLVAQRLGKMRGLPQKIGQMVAFNGNQSDQDDFGSLYQSADPLPWATMRPLLEAAWDIDPETLFAEIDPQAKAASLGQVHAATTHDGRKLAIKIQYPGIRDATEADLKSLGWLASPFGNLSRGFDLEGYRQTIWEGLQEELDYRREAAAQSEFAAGPGSSEWVIVPAIDKELTTENILVSDWVDGETWEEVQANWSAADKAELGKRWLKWFLECVFVHGQIHADMHPGNVRFIRDHQGPKIVLYDFGSVYRMSRAEQLALLRLISATRLQNEAPLPLFLAIGFREDVLESLASRLPALCRVLFEPFVVDYPYDLADWNLSERLNDVLGAERMNFRIAGPPKLVFLLRAFQGTITYLKGLEAKVDWGRMIQPLFQRYIADMQQLKLPQIAAPDFATMAKYLKIEVVRDSQVKAAITLAAAAINRIENYLEPETLEKIRRDKIDLNEVLRSVRRRGYAPGSVFEIKDAQREVKVWLE